MKKIIITLGVLGFIIILIALYIIKYSLKMKKQGNENFIIYATGCTLMMPGMILSLYFIIELIYTSLFK